MIRSNFNANGGESVNTDEEGPGLLSSVAFWVLGTLSAVGFWTLIAWGLEAAF